MGCAAMGWQPGGKRSELFFSLNKMETDTGKGVSGNQSARAMPNSLVLAAPLLLEPVSTREQTRSSHTVL